jgi:hypothetical protein|nr:MAG: hypothetical protein J07AB56_08070 [Candidatus Nanosalinarum sp. J07AB56]
MDGDEIPDKYVFGLEYPENPADDGNLYEDVSQENVMNALEHPAFRSQDMFVYLRDPEEGLHYEQPRTNLGNADMAFMLREVKQEVGHHSDANYDVVYTETRGGLEMHAETCSTYEIVDPHEGPVDSYLGFKNRPKMEQYEDRRTADLADIDKEVFLSLLEGEDPTPSMWESMRRFLDRIEHAKHLFRR